MTFAVVDMQTNEKFESVRFWRHTQRVIGSTLVCWVLRDLARLVRPAPPRAAAQGMLAEAEGSMRLQARFCCPYAAGYGPWRHGRDAAGLCALPGTLQFHRCTHKFC